MMSDCGRFNAVGVKVFSVEILNQTLNAPSNNFNGSSPKIVASKE
jgi:hypothetical protein